MAHCDTIISRILKLPVRHDFERIAKMHHSGRSLHTASRFNHWFAYATAQWTAQQIVEAFLFDTAPRYLLRDRDSLYGGQFSRRVKSLGIEEVLTAPRSPWQSPYVERLIANHVVAQYVESA